MNAFKNIISNKEFFTYSPDCITDGASYRELIEKAFLLTGGGLKLIQFDWESEEGSTWLYLIVNGIPHTIEVDHCEEYVDNTSLIAGLNELLTEVRYKGKRRFCDTDGGMADFGIAFISKQQEARLAENELILRPRLAVAV